MLPMATAPPYPYTQPARRLRLEPGEEDVRFHCNIKQVKAFLLGQDLSALADPGSNGCSYELLWDTLVPMWIQQVSNFICKECRTSFDWCYRILFFDGSGSNELVLPDRNLYDVLAVWIRVLPSNTWYYFQRPRKVNGEEFSAIGGAIETPIAPETIPPTPLSAATITGPVPFSGIEDADLLVDVQRRIIKIPPRVLYAGINVPLWNYVFNPGALNIETHYTFGFPATKYTDGSPLQYNPSPPSGNGLVIEPKPNTTNVMIDWSSGMPTLISSTVAQMVANYVMRQRWRAETGGISSLSVDGANESYGSAPYGGDLDKQDKAMLERLVSKYAVQMVL